MSAVDLDELCGGRLLVGIGSGNRHINEAVPGGGARPAADEDGGDVDSFSALIFSAPKPANRSTRRPGALHALGARCHADPRLDPRLPGRHPPQDAEGRGAARGRARARRAHVAASTSATWSVRRARAPQRSTAERLRKIGFLLVGAGVGTGRRGRRPRTSLGRRSAACTHRFRTRTTTGSSASKGSPPSPTRSEGTWSDGDMAKPSTRFPTS